MGGLKRDSFCIGFYTEVALAFMSLRLLCRGDTGFYAEVALAFMPQWVSEVSEEGGLIPDVIIQLEGLVLQS